MKKTAIFITFFIILISMSDSLKGNRFSEKHKIEVEKQKAADQQRREAILKQYNAFTKKFKDKVPKERVSFDTPVSIDFVTSISNTNDFHYKGVIPPKIYGYVNASTLNMRSTGDTRSEITGKLVFKDRVEILFQSDTTEVISGMEAPWLLIRKDSGEEGWVFGAYISENTPTEKDRDTGKTDWGMIIPTSGRISSQFGYRVDPVTKQLNTFHSGIDIAAPTGTPVYAADSGKVADTQFQNTGYGNLIIIQHGTDLATYYGHLSKIDTSKGKEVKKGDLIGKVGSTGKSTGPHLHFEIRKGGQALNPDAYIK